MNFQFSPSVLWNVFKGVHTAETEAIMQAGVRLTG